jgi:hypothetical protein
VVMIRGENNRSILKKRRLADGKNCWNPNTKLQKMYRCGQYQFRMKKYAKCKPYTRYKVAEGIRTLLKKFQKETLKRRESSELIAIHEFYGKITIFVPSGISRLCSSTVRLIMLREFVNHVYDVCGESRTPREIRNTVRNMLMEDEDDLNYSFREHYGNEEYVFETYWPDFLDIKRRYNLQVP